MILAIWAMGLIRNEHAHHRLYISATVLNTEVLTFSFRAY